MDAHRQSKLKQSETTKFLRMPSPMTYISNYNKICIEENEQTKQCMPIEKKHKGLFLWNDGYIQLNRISMPSILEERKNKRKTFQANPFNLRPSLNHSNQQLNVGNNQNNYGSTARNPGRKESIGQLNQVRRESNNQASMNSLSNGNGLNNFVRQNENNPPYNGIVMTEGSEEEQQHDSYRTYRHLREKQQELDLQRKTEMLEKIMVENNEKQFRLTLGRQGNSLMIDRNQMKYFSNTKQQMLELQNHMLTSQKISKEIMDRKGLSLRKVLASIPHDKLMDIIDRKQFHFQKIMNEKILPKKQFRLKSHISPRFTGVNNYDHTRPFTTTTVDPLPLMTPTKTNSKPQTANGQGIYKCDESVAKKRKSSQASIGVVQEEENETAERQEKLKEDEIYYSKQICKPLGQKNGQKKESEYEESENKKTLRVKSNVEVKSIMKKLHEIKSKHNEDHHSEAEAVLTENGGMTPCNKLQSCRPKASLDKMFQQEDEGERNCIMNSLENRQKTNKDKNFFNYPNYFYGKYQQQNNGLSTKLSSNALQENENFQKQILQLIKQVDNDHHSIHH